MTNLIITPANVVAGANSRQRNGISGGSAVQAGDVIYQASDDEKWHRADNNDVVAAGRAVGGIALNSADINQPVRVHEAGDITLGAVGMVPGAAYYLSQIPGGICPYADLAAGMDVVQIGIAKSASVLAVDIQRPKITL